MIEQAGEKLAKNSVMYFMLPMLQLNRASFGVGNFINSYIDRSGYLVVDLVAVPPTASSIYDHEMYVTDFNISTGLRVVYAVPDEFKSDIRLFEAGKYSQFSAALKVAISKFANLKTEDIHVRCLNPQKEDRQKIADDLGVRVDLVRELKSAPSESNFISIK